MIAHGLRRFMAWALAGTGNSVTNRSFAGCRLSGTNLEVPCASCQATLQTRDGSFPMDDYQDELLEWHAAEQDCPDSAEDAVEL